MNKIASFNGIYFIYKVVSSKWYAATLGKF